MNKRRVEERARVRSQMSRPAGNKGERILAVLALAFIAALPGVIRGADAQSASGAGAGIRREKIEWTWSDHSDALDPKLPNVLLVGDSITRAYFPEVARRFAGRANVYLFATSCSSGDPGLTQQLHLYFEAAPAFAVIHFNNGMHGWEYSDREFAAGLPGMIHELEAERPKSRLIWATITPVRKDNEAGPSNSRIDVRNRLALEVVQREGIPVDDQHALMETHSDLHLDDVHFNEQGSALEGEQAAKSIERIFAPTRDATLR